MSLVLDASLALSWIFEDEANAIADAVLDKVTASGAWVPALWRLEVANVLQVAVRRGRIDRDYRASAIQRLGDLSLRVDLDTDRHAWSGTLRLADQFSLTLYDAAYLELARRLDLPLATRDAALAKATHDSGLKVLGL